MGGWEKIERNITLVAQKLPRLKSCYAMAVVGNKTALQNPDLFYLPSGLSKVVIIIIGTEDDPVI